MNTTPTANQLSGRAIGSLFFTGFGAMWIALALYAKEILTTVNTSLALLGLAVLLPGCLWLFRQSKRFDRLPEDPAIARTFKTVNAIQWIAVGLVAITFNRLHLDAYALSAITAIVGLHLFPFAKLFRYPLHYATAIAMVLWAAIPLLTVSADHLQGTTALGTGLILWISAAISNAIGIQAVRRADSSQAASSNLEARSLQS